MSDFNMMGAVGYRISHTDESQNYPIATIKIAFKIPKDENCRLEMFHVHEALRRMIAKKELSFELTMPPSEPPKSWGDVLDESE